MIEIQPQTLHRADDSRLIELAGAFVDERIAVVNYVQPADVGWESGVGVKSVHEVEMGVELAAESGLVLALSWATPGVNEGLSIALNHKEQQAPDELVDRVDVSESHEWRAIVGQPVQTFAISFYEHTDYSSLRPWSFRVGTSSNHCATVTLGEVVDNELRYMPDNLVVIFDESVARSYWFPGSLQSAWGEIVLDGRDR